MELTDLEKWALKVLNISDEQFKKDLDEQDKKSIVKQDVNNLGDSLVTVMIDSDNLGSTIVDLLIKQAELEERIIALEGGTANA